MADDEDLFAPMEIESNDDAPEVEAEAETPEVEAKPTPEPQAEKPDTMVPLAALQAERAAGKATKERLDRIEAMLNAQTAQKQEPAPDMYSDPDAYQAYMSKTVETRLASMAADVSEMLTRQAYGEEFADEALAAAQTAGVIDQFKGRKDPWGDLAKWHKAQKAVAEIGDDPAAWREKEQQRIRSEILAEAAQSVKQPAYGATPSLAGQTNIGNRATPAWSGPTTLDDILGGGS